MSRLATCI